jgi:hypothetical protein
MAEATAPKIEYVDVPGISETYADAVRGMMFDGQNVRLELCVTRLEDPKKGNGSMSGKRQTAARVVLPVATALELSNQLGRVLTTLAKRGAERKAKQAAPAQGEAKPS